MLCYIQVFEESWLVYLFPIHLFDSTESLCGIHCARSQMFLWVQAIIIFKFRFVYKSKAQLLFICRKYFHSSYKYINLNLNWLFMKNFYMKSLFSFYFWLFSLFHWAWKIAKSKKNIEWGLWMVKSRLILIESIMSSLLWNKWRKKLNSLKSTTLGNIY